MFYIASYAAQFYRIVEASLRGLQREISQSEPCTYDNNDYRLKQLPYKFELNKIKEEYRTAGFVCKVLSCANILYGLAYFNSGVSYSQLHSLALSFQLTHVSQFRTCDFFILQLCLCSNTSREGHFQSREPDPLVAGRLSLRDYERALIISNR